MVEARKLLLQIKVKNGVLKAKAKNARKAFKEKLAVIQDIFSASADAIESSDSSINLPDLVTSSIQKGKKALKFKSPNFAKRKKSALKALKNLEEGLAG